MSCNNPEQLELDLDSYAAFKDALVPTLHGEWNPGGHNYPVEFLDKWQTINDFVSTAAWTKKLLLELKGKGPARLCTNLLRAFGRAFRGDEVGALGLDIIGYALHQPRLETRLGAYYCLEHWLEDDEAGVWLDVANDHIDKEPDGHLKNLFVELVRENMDALEELDEEVPDPPELKEFLQVTRALKNRARGLLEVKELPAFLEKLVEVDRGFVLGLLESVQVGRLVVESPKYGMLLSPLGSKFQLRAWRLDGKNAFSIEPTASDDSWLVFARF